MTNAQIVQQYYIAYYGRPADPDGFNFWVGQLDSGAPLSDLVAAFGSSSQPEFVGLYGENPSAEEFFIEAYRNVLNRGIENDPEGLAFWVGVYNNLVAEGASPAEARAGLLAEFIAGVENGSQRDQDTLANKIALAELTTDKALSLPDSTDVNDLINFVRDDAFMREDIASSEEFESHKAAIEAYHKEQGGAPVNFTLQEVDLGTLTIDPTVVGLEPTIEKVAYWGDGPDGNGVPLENVLELYFGTAFINGFNNFVNSAANVADVIEAIVAAGALDALQGEGAIGNGVVITDADENVVTVNEDGSVVISLKEGDYTGDFEFVLNVDSEDLANAQISLTQEQFDMLRDILINADGSSRLYEVEEEVWGKVAIDRTTGAPILDGVTDGSDVTPVIDSETGEPILVDLKQFITSPGAEIDLTAPIVLTTTDNNGGTLESGFTTAGDETIVAGRLELLHQAYIDAGFGVNTLEVDAKGLFAQPLGLFNIQHVNVENLPNVYTDSTDGSTYPDVAGTQGTQTSVLDLSRAVDIETLTVTEGDYTGLNGQQTPGSLTLTGIRNGAVTTLDGSFTQTVKLNYSELQGDGVSLVFNNLSMGDAENGSAQLQVAHNAETLNIEVNGNSYLGNTDLGGQLNNMVITGSGHLYIEGDLGESFHNETPVTIDASGNTGGVDLRLEDSEQVTFLGSQGNDRFMVETDEASGEVNSGGSDQSVTIVDMDGDNHFEVESSNIDITVGDGNNNLELDGGGFNNDSGSQTTATVVAGAGANTISARDLDVVNISTGDGDNVIGVNADDITVTTGAGNDTVIVSGEGGISDLSDGGGQVDDEVNTSDTALININVGGGDNTVVLGGDVNGVNYTSGVTAVEGSSISGENITLYVEEPSDLRAAALSGIERVVLDLDTSTPLTDDTSNNYGVAPVLTLTDSQFADIGAENFSVDGSPFGTYAQVKIIVTESTSLTDLGVDSLPPNVDLQLELRDGVTLELTAQQLHEKVAPEGITLADDNNTDQLSGSVLITGAGTDFDPFNTNDQVRSSIDGQTYFGGSLSPTDFANDDDSGSDPGAGTIERNEWGSNVLLDRTLNGYNRPADAPSYSRLVIDTDQQGGELGPFQTIETFLRIVGEADMAFTPVPGEIDDWGRPIEGGTAIGLGVDNGEPTNGFMVDFSGASGDVTNLAFSGFENAEAMFGNGSASRDVRVNVEITEGESVASEDSGLVSRGIQTYVVTEITEGDVEQGSADTAEFWTSRVTQNLEVLGLQGNYDDTITFGNTERGVEFLMEVAYDKFDGYAVGTLVGDFARPGASAVVNIENISGDLPAGEVMKVAGITLENATSGTINVAEGDAVIESLVTDAGAALTFNALDDLTVEGPLPSLSVLDADGVDGVFTLSLSGTANDISDTQVSGVEAVILANGADFELTFAQLADIGAENISVENPGDMATLSLEQLGEEPFAASDLNLGVGVSVNSVTIIPEPVVTLHPDTDLSGISSLTILEGTTLNMTAEQFVQLAIGGGAIEGEGTINVTAGSQADVDAALAAIDDGQTVSMTIDGDITQGTFELVTDVDLPGLISGTLGEFEYLIGGNRLTLSDVELADGVQITGEAGSVLQFTDLTGFLVNIDASGFDVDELHITDLLVSGNNVDYIFENLPEGVTKVIYNGDGDVTGRVQNVVIEEGTTIFDDISFNEYQLDSEIAFITMNLEGGTRVDGDLVLSTVEVNIADDNLIPGYLRELVINSSGTAGNNVTGNTANIIDGDITPAAYGPAIGVGSRDNNLKAVTINADQDFVVTGSILFSSHGDDNAAPLNNQPDDGVTANDDDAAIATLTVTGSADVSAGTLDTSDDDIDGLNVVNNGTGTLSATLDAAALDASDVFSFTGTGAVELTVVGTIDLSGSDLTAVTQITIAENADLTLTQAQFDALGAAGLVDGGASGNATLNLVEFGEDPFDATALAAGITVASITMAAGSNTLDAATDLTDVGQIIVPEGGELNLTAAQFQQLQGNGTIVGASGTDYTVNITDLTQADVDAGFDLTGVTADNLTVTLGEDVNLAASDDLAGASVFIPDNLTLGLATAVQADGLVVDGGTDSTVVFQFDDTTGLTGGLFAQIDASGYTVTTVKALATFIGGLNAEYTIDDLPSSVVLQLFEDAEELGFLSPTNRIVVVEEDVTVPANGSGDALIFNDWDSDDEVRTLSITLDGGVVVDGDVSLPTRTDKDGNLTQRYFDTLTLISQGDSVNTIDGAIDTQPTLGGANTDENNLLNVVINATQDLSVTGALVFNHTAGSNTTATLTLLGDADVTIKSLDTTDTSITGLVVDNQGTGTLTVTGGSDALELNDTTSLTFSGTGDIVLDTDTGGGNNGIEGDDLESIDASGLSGDLDLGVVEDISSTDFVFTAGTGVTSMTLVADDLNADVNANPAETGWTFDFSSAAAGSEFHIGDGPGGEAAPTFTQGPLNIDLGANTTLYIDENTDWSGLDLTLQGSQPIVLADGVTLTLTAAQASGLNIIAGPDDGTYNGQVVINDLGDYADLNTNGSNDDPAELIDYDFSGIQVPASATLADDDVTLSAATDLGNVSIGLTDVADDTDPNTADALLGQTIRFATEEQAARTITVSGGVQGEASVNVIWLFDSVSGPVNTDNYSADITRLWFLEDLVNGQNVEQLFTSLPSTIIRVDFADLNDLPAALAESDPFNRTVELAAFTNLPGGLAFSDEERLQHVENLTLDMGGEATVGDIEIDNIVDPTVNQTLINFTTLTINSVLADDTGDLLAADGYDETSNVRPTGPNVVGDISVGAAGGFELLDVVLNTGLDLSGNDTTPDDTVDVLTGNELELGTIVYSADTAGATVTLTATGENDITAKAIDATDSDINTVDIDVTGLAAGTNLVFTGGSPALSFGENGEALTVTQGEDGSNFINDGTVWFGYVEDGNGGFELHDDGQGNFYAGVYGEELSSINLQQLGGVHDVHLGVLADIDGNDDGPSAAFTLVGVSLNPADTTATLGEGNVNGQVVAPELEAGSTWRFENATITLTDTAILNAGANLEFTQSVLIIDGDVDLSEVNLTLGLTPISVPAGSSLTLTVEQAETLTSDITGSGTVKLVGEGDDAVAANVGAHLRTAVVDLSAVVLTAADADDAFAIELPTAGALLDDGTSTAGFTVTGSANADVITGSALADSITGGAGDDTVTGGNGADTYTVDDGTDTIVGLTADGTDDVLVVEAGAEAIAGGVETFVATADTTNDGVATLTGHSGDSLIDVSLAGGANGFTLVGGPEDDTGIENGANTLIGSEGDDIINGGDSEQVADSVDVLTGNGGNDTFAFNVIESTPQSLTGITATEAVDEEILTLESGTNNATATNATEATLTVNYTLNQTLAAVVVNLAGMDISDDEVIMTAVAGALNGIQGITAQAVLDGGTGDWTVVATGDNGNRLGLGPVTENGSDFDDADGNTAGVQPWTGNIGNLNNDVDTEQVDTVTVGGGTNVIGEVYSITATLRDGTVVEAEYVTDGTESTDVALAAAIAGEFNSTAGGAGIAATANGDGTITFDTGAAAGDQGGFTLTFDTEGAISGTGASPFTTTALAQLYAESDIITDFTSGEDVLDLGIADGTASNTVEAGTAAADFASALASAETNFDASNGAVQFYFSWFEAAQTDEVPGVIAEGDTVGVLFLDANKDGFADGHIRLVGVDGTGFDAVTDIVA